MSATVAIAAGGTGGHLLPGFAIARALEAAAPGTPIVFVSSERGLGGELVSAAGYRMRTTRVRPFGGGARAVRAAASIPGAVRAARAILAEEDVGVVIGMGGYPSVPAVIAARTRGVPAIIHEANAVPGLANQLAARFTRHVAVTFPATATAFGRRRPRLTGMPLRAELVALDRAAVRAEAVAAFGLPAGARVVVAFGGSLGARSITDAVAGFARAWAGRADVAFLIASGRERADEVVASLGDARATVVPFIERMDLAYAAADLVVARAGSSTVNELAAVGVPSILVPYPHARRREQHANARLLGDVDAAVVLEDAALGRLPGIAGSLLEDPARLEAMGKAARSVARIDAAETIAAWALELAP